VPNGAPFQAHDARLDQGDILANVPFVKWKDGSSTPATPGRGIITSNGCACEDYERALAAGHTQAANKLMLQVAPLRLVRDLPEHRVDEIQSGRQLDSFWVYGDDGTVLGDQRIDLTYEQPIPASVLIDCTKIARIAPWQWRALLIHIAVARFHQKPATLFRPEILDQAAASQ